MFKLKWTNTKIAYVSILVAASVSFVLIGSKLMAITVIPSFKMAFGGLPVKITGYLFGPIIGALTGVISDLLSFAFFPTVYHPGYTLSMGLSGFIPGVIGVLMRKGKPSMNKSFWITWISLMVVFIAIFFTIQFLPQDIFTTPKKNGSYKFFLHERWQFQILTLTGIGSMIFMIIILRFKMSEKNFNGISGILIFTAILEVTNSLLLPIWDKEALGIDYKVAFVGHMLYSPFKIWGNMLIVFYTWKIAYPIISNKTSNTY